MTEKSKWTKQELDTRFEQTMKNETKYGILMAIRTFGSMNIKLLSRIMGKTESTIHHHISEMLKEPPILILDNEKTTTTRGIYYTLSENMQKRYPKDKDTVFEEEIPLVMKRALKLTDEEIAKIMIARVMNQPDFGEIAGKIRRSLNYTHNIENFIVTSFERAETALKNGLKPKNLLYPFGSSTKMDMNLKISKPRHALEIGVVINDFFAQLVKTKQKIISEMNQEKIPEEKRIRVHYQLFGGEVEDFEFEEDESFDLNEYLQPVENLIRKIYAGIDET